MSSYVYKKGGACPSKECDHYYQRYGHESLRIQALATIMVLPHLLHFLILYGGTTYV